MPATEEPQVIVVQPSFNHLTPYDSTTMSLKAWFELFQHFCYVNDIPKEPTVVEPAVPPYNKRRALFLSHLSTRVYEYLSAACLPTPPKDLPIPVLYEKLEKRFQPPGLIQTNRYHFGNRNQRPNENAEDFLCALQTLALNCNFGNYWEEAIRDRLINGARSHTARSKCLDQQPNTIAATLKILSQEEAVQEQAKLLSQQLNRISVNDNRSKSLKPADNANKTAASAPNQPKKSNGNGNGNSKRCYRCGRSHDPKSCFALKLTCKKCTLRGHLANMCKTKRSRINHLQSGSSTSGPSPQPQSDPQPKGPAPEFSNPLLQVLTFWRTNRRNSNVFVVAIGALKASPPLLVNLTVNNVILQFEIDTGAGITVMALSTFKALFPSLQLQKSTVLLSALSGLIENTGEVSVKVKFNDATHDLLLITCKHASEFKPLLGRDWLDVLWPNWRQALTSQVALCNVQSTPIHVPSLEQLQKMFPRPFAINSDTAIEGYTARLVLKDNAQPIFAKAYPLPFGMEKPVNEVLDNLVQSGKAVRVRVAEWASPGFAVPKKDGKVRYVADFKRTLNPQLRVDYYPLPRPDHVFSNLSNGKFFTSLDLTDAYTQLVLHPDSQELCVLNTHKGLYKLTRLIYGVNSAAAIFQSTMDSILDGLPGCQKAFDNTKKLLQSSDLLMHFDPELPIILSTDASPVGVGCVLAHVVKVDGKVIERPVMFASATLTSAQQNYSQVDREAFAVIFADTKLYKFLWGRQFTICTDNSAIQRILSPDKGLPLRTNHRLQHWATILQGFNYQIVHRKSSLMSVPDALSRLPSPVSLNYVTPLIKLPITVDVVSEQTLSDPLLSKVIDFTHHGWPDHNPFPNHSELTEYFKRRDQLSIQQKCLMMGNRVIIPPWVKRSSSLNLAHGTPRSQNLARSYFWWPSITSDIQNLITNCSPCAKVNLNPKPEFIPWTPSKYPFERVHIDFYSYKHHQFFIFSDSYSKWLHIQIMPTTVASAVNNVLFSIFAMWGCLPTSLVSDNGPPFDSSEFIQFLTNLNITLKHSPIYHPPSNAQAERGVGIAKKGLDKILEELGGVVPGVTGSSKPNNPISQAVLSDAINIFLFTHHNTPCTVTQKSPNQMLLSFKPRTFLSQSNPTQTSSLGLPSSFSRFRPGDKVTVRLNNSNLEGVIIRQIGVNNYFVNINGVIKQVHFNQLSLKP
ncbi:hypothetical protein KUF71_026111 [Frankliniella fusca]|uniref:RNA-directed DNA polymerase n=1 Tax=Frankliniella fusca TaxID=407009 RepID=A0AAE1LGI9_9NEOP|nr:hypothetical protein KUF71_026111 [Frankliniella fusca]